MTMKSKKPIGEMNGLWGILLKVLLVTFVPWATFITYNQILDNDFRGQGRRWTATDAEVQTKTIISELIIFVHEELRKHENSGHAVLQARIAFLERVFPEIVDCESDRIEILRAIQQDIHSYAQFVMTKQRESEEG